jgi:hypothetical protein
MLMAEHGNLYKPQAEKKAVIECVGLQAGGIGRPNTRIVGFRRAFGRLMKKWGATRRSATPSEIQKVSEINE